MFTVAESAALRARIVGGKSKNLFLKDKKGRLFLLTAQDEAAVDLKRLHETLGVRGASPSRRPKRCSRSGA